MEAIDGGIYNAQSSADSASAEAQNAQSSADNAQQTANTAVTNAGQAQSKADSVDTKVGNLAELETTSKLDIVSAINELKANIENFNLSIFETPTNVVTNVGTITYTNLSVAKNTDGSLAKIYGAFYIGNIPSSASDVTVSFQTSLRPTSEIIINNLVKASQYYPNSALEMQVSSIKIKTNGVVETTIYKLRNAMTNFICYLDPVLLFIKDFGDVPITPQI